MGEALITRRSGSCEEELLSGLPEVAKPNSNGDKFVFFSVGSEFTISIPDTNTPAGQVIQGAFDYSAYSNLTLILPNVSGFLAQDGGQLTYSGIVFKLNEPTTLTSSDGRIVTAEMYSNSSGALCMKTSDSSGTNYVLYSYKYYFVLYGG